MKYSELDLAFIEIFGCARGRALQSDLVLTALDSRTALAAAEDGVDPQIVWNAVCDEMELEEQFRFPHRRQK